MWLCSSKRAPLVAVALLAPALLARAQDETAEGTLVDPQAEAQAAPAAFHEPAAVAFEEGRWEDAIREFRELLAAYPEDRISPLRIAQAERELGRHERALETLEQARTANSPESMVDVERARNLLALGRKEEGLTALEMADHVGLRALGLLDETKDFDSVRADPRFADVYRHVRERVFPCEAMPEAGDFDFWLGEWEVRAPDGSLAGHNTITKRNGGCLVQEEWRGGGASTGTSVSFFQPSRGQWRQVWTGSNGTMFDISGGLVDGAMRMEGTIEYVYPAEVVAFRGTWTENADGLVRQRLEEFDLVAGTWVLWFEGFFRRVGETSAISR
jgi:hypothetical protein